MLKYAGRKKRDLPDLPDEEILLLAMKDMNIAKLTSGNFQLSISIQASVQSFLK